MKRSENVATHIGLVSLPVMACMLAAVLYGSRPEQMPDPDEAARILSEARPEAEQVRQRIDLATNRLYEAAAALNEVKRLQAASRRFSQQIAELNSTIARLEKQAAEAGTRISLREKIEALKRKLAEMTRMKDSLRALELEKRQLEQEIESLTRDIARIEAGITKAQERVALRKTLSELEAELARLTEEIALLKKKKDDIENRLDLVGLGEFPRPYMSLEFKKDGVDAYAPGKEPAALRPPLAEARRTQLKEQIEEVGAVVFFVRSSGFETYEEMLTAKDGILSKILLGKMEVSWSVIPIQDFEDISGHILLGGGE